MNKQNSIEAQQNALEALRNVAPVLVGIRLDIARLTWDALEAQNMPEFSKWAEIRDALQLVQDTLQRHRIISPFTKQNAQPAS
jgi:hypothetical protein